MRTTSSVVLLLVLLAGFAPSTSAQASLRLQRETGRAMLEQIRDRIKEYYYDPAFHQLDLNELYKSADDAIKKAETEGQIVALLAGFALSLEDSHTRFYPGPRSIDYDYGWVMEIVGDDCFITAVKPGSDAEKKGVREGDQVLSVLDEVPSRANLWRTRYFIYSISPQRVMKVTLRSPGAEPRNLEIATGVSRPYRAMDGRDQSGLQRQRIEDQKANQRGQQRFHEFGGEALVWKVPDFDRERFEINEVFDRVRKFKTLIIDLRGNRGGADETLLAIIGNLFDRDVKVADLVLRKGRRSLIAKTRGKQSFTGKVTILVDAETTSWGEVLARVIQLEKRGTVIGDVTAGRVMRSRDSLEYVGADALIRFAVSVTDADVYLTDGKRLEMTGVKPDELLLPSPADMAAHRDPVLARACALNGVPLEPIQAGTLFPYIWPE
ncbi:MAG: S41 family peptidase [Pyrinomonadaceae bacterium]